MNTSAEMELDALVPVLFKLGLGILEMLHLTRLGQAGHVVVVETKQEGRLFNISFTSALPNWPNCDDTSLERLKGNQIKFSFFMGLLAPKELYT